MLFKSFSSSIIGLILTINLSYAEEPQTSDKPLVKKRPNLVERSTLLANEGHWVMIPKTALIFTPERYKDNVVTKAQGSLLTWSAFLKKNRGWIHTHEVNLLQAKGKELVDQKVIAAYKSMGKVVIATYKNNPITVKAAALLPPEKKGK